MKKVLIVAALMLSSVATFAQSKIGSLSVMPKVGLNIACLTDASGTDPRIGLVVGADLWYQVNHLLAISGGVNYSMQGCKYSGSGQDITTKLDYINIPILANFYVAKNFALKVGIQPAFNVKDKVKYDYGNSSYEAESSAKSFDFAIPLGLSYEFENFVIDARYNWGVTKVWNDSDSKNSVFQISLGYKLGI